MERSHGWRNEVAWQKYRCKWNLKIEGYTDADADWGLYPIQHHQIKQNEIEQHFIKDKLNHGILDIPLRDFWKSVD